MSAEARNWCPDDTPAPVCNIWNELYVKTTLIQSLTNELNHLNLLISERKKRNEKQCNLLKEKENIQNELFKECIELRTIIDIHEDDIQQYRKTIELIDGKIQREEVLLNEKREDLLNLRAEYCSSLSNTTFLGELSTVKVELSQVGTVMLLKRRNSDAELARSIAESQDTLNSLTKKLDDIKQCREADTRLHQQLLVKVRELDADILNEKAKQHEIKPKLDQKKTYSPFKPIGEELQPSRFQSHVTIPPKFIQASASQNVKSTHVNAIQQRSPFKPAREESQPLIHSQVSTPPRFTQGSASQNMNLTRVSALQQRLPFKPAGENSQPLIHSHVSTPPRFTQGSASLIVTPAHNSSFQSHQSSAIPVCDVPIKRSHGLLTSIKTDGYAPPLKNRVQGIPNNNVAANVKTEVVANKKKFVPKKAMFSELQKYSKP